MYEPAGKWIRQNRKSAAAGLRTPSRSNSHAGPHNQAGA